MDNWISFLETNNIHYNVSENVVSFYLTHKEWEVEVFYDNKANKFFIHKNNYKNQPHIISHWNHGNIDGLVGLCLTMDNSFRPITFNNVDKIERIKEIIFELWKDPIFERFKELETTLGVKRTERVYLDRSMNLVSRVHGGDLVYTLKDVHFSVDVAQDYDEMIKGEYDDNTIINVHYNGLVKRFLVQPSLSKNILIFDDFTEQTFFGRTKMLIKDKDFIVIGCGSVGGEVIDFLIRNGAKHISIYDDDILKSDNTTRHKIGKPHANLETSKVGEVKRFYDSKYPNITLLAYEEKFDYEKAEIGNTIVINTTGGSWNASIKNICGLYLNNEKEDQWQYIDIFIEPFGAAMHMVVSNMPADYKKIDWNERGIVRPDKDFRESFQGCFVPTLPYSYIPIQVGVPLLMHRFFKFDLDKGHYTAILKSISTIEKENINEGFPQWVDKNRIGVIKWK